MAGHYKQRAGYIVMRFNFFDTKEFIQLEHEFGDLAYKYHMLLCMEIRNNSYYMSANEAKLKHFARVKGMNFKKLRKFIEKSVEFGMYDREMYLDHLIITSKKIQEEWLRDCRESKLKNPDINVNYFIISEPMVKKISGGNYSYGSAEEFKPSIYDKVIKAAQNQLPSNQTEIPLTVGDVKVVPEKKKEIKVVLPEPPAVNKSGYNESTLEVHRVISIPWAEQTEEFKKMHDEQWFKSYVTMNKLIDTEYQNIRTAKTQLHIGKYKKLMSEIKIKKIDELEEVFKKMCSSGTPENCDIYYRIIEFIATIRRNKEKKPVINFNT